ncbi:hypothetical protein [Candidatus Tokpelaia sp.]|uniref:hypothetical protein n=1 Tax=Candidatus Tokpelaia sp. TaxID=2233777 RepID=UPI0012397985|nr:hypothetical protein [Candidatus Tokpelaia sp.]KAA6406039.1 hypothetical protein DPQ22_00880 [Candidatus Tokpelaia sp.]
MQNWAASVSVLAAIIAGGVALWTARQGRKATKKLETEKNKYAQELETLKRNLDFHLTQKLKFTEKEFDALAVCWQKLQVVHKTLLTMRSSIDALYFLGDENLFDILCRSSKTDCENFLKNLAYDFTAEAQKAISKAEGGARLQLFLTYFLQKYINEIALSQQDFIRYYDDNCIFLNPFFQENITKTIEFTKEVFAGLGLVLKEVNLVPQQQCDKKFVEQKLNYVRELTIGKTTDNREHFDILRGKITEKLFPEMQEGNKERQNG